MNGRKSRERRRMRAAAGSPITADTYLRQPYVRKVVEASRGLAPGLSHIGVFHDSWCPLLRGIGPCACRPEVIALDGDVH